MDMNNDQLAKTLVSLIDETLGEIEELKKSKFSAAEIKIEGPGEGVAGKPSNGELDAKKAEKEEDKKDEAKKEVEKKEKEEDEKEGEEKEDAKVKKGVLDEAEKESVEKKEKEDEDEDEKEEIKKNNEQVTEELIKSYIDTKISPLENKLSTIIEMVNKMADQPLERKSIPAGNIVPLKKNNETMEILSKSDITNKLFDLKKNGTDIDSLDMIKVELGTQVEAAIIANKYGLK